MPPTQITGSPWQSAWNSNATPKKAPASGSFAVGVGGLIVVEAVDENSATLGTPTNTATSPASITWTLQRNFNEQNNFSGAYAWTGEVTAAGNVQVSVARTGGSADDFGVIVWAFPASGHGGVGQTVVGHVSGSVPSLTPGAPWTAHSTVCCANGDWTAVSWGATRSYLTNLGAATERNYAAVDGNYTTGAWEYADAGASPGSGAVGLSSPSQKWTMVGVEVLAPTGGGGTTDTAPQGVAVGQGTAPSTKATGSQGAASAAGPSPSVTAAGTQGVATAQGRTPAAKATGTAGTATGAGNAPVAAVAAGRGVAVGQGFSPADSLSTGDTAPQGVAVAVGRAPAPRVVGTVGVTTAVGRAPASRVTASFGVAVAQGASPTVAAAVTFAAIVTQGRSPVSVSALVPLGVAQGVGVHQGRTLPAVDLPTLAALEAHVTTAGLESRSTTAGLESRATTAGLEGHTTTAGIDG